MIKTCSFYKFFPIKKSVLLHLKKKLEEKALEQGVRGLFLLSEEGVNATVSSKTEALESFKSWLEEVFGQDFIWKDFECEEWNFKRFSLKIKKEIVSSWEEARKEDLSLETNTHLSPKQWQKKIEEEEVQILDVRNHYETKLGKFKKAKVLDLDVFQDFPKKIKNSSLKKDKPTLIYCTGGIRCEKVVGTLKKEGFEEVYQLEGGILNYLKEFPNKDFEKECFVFDHRVAVGQDLKASKVYSLCPHCGDPAKKKVPCGFCEKEALVCETCLEKAFFYKSCSKNCSYHFRKGHKRRSLQVSQ